jgi:hypothetical protein
MSGPLYSLFVEGNLLAEFTTRSEAERALHDVVDEAPDVADDALVVEFRDGEPIRARQAV